jgi:precorrin-3B synthase
MSGQRKGWCPGALKPMRTGDGLLVRVRLTAGVLEPETAKALARAARDFGNGLLDLTARANLQMRGVSDETLEPLLDRLAQLGVLDESEAAEQVRNVLASPLAGIDPTELIDAGPLVQALERRLTAEAAFQALPGKFGFLIDGGGALPLDDVEADIGLRAVDAEVFRLTAGDVELGVVRREDAVEAALEVAATFLRLRQPDERRMRNVMGRLQDETREIASDEAEEGTQTKSGRERCGPLAIFGQDLASLLIGENDGGGPHPSRPGFAAPPSPASWRGRVISRLAGYQAFSPTSGFFAAAAPFGRLDADQLEGLGAIASNHNLALRLSLWRALLLAPHKQGLAPLIAAEVAALGLVINPDDPRLAIAACPGSPSCLSGEAPAQIDAARLAPVLASFVRQGASVHVSGCAKGCARRAPASLVLVGQNGRYGLAFHADSHASSETPPMDVDEIAAFLKRPSAEEGFKRNNHV